MGLTTVLREVRSILRREGRFMPAMEIYRIDKPPGSTGTEGTVPLVTGSPYLRFPAEYLHERTPSKEQLVVDVPVQQKPAVDVRAGPMALQTDGSGRCSPRHRAQPFITRELPFSRLNQQQQQQQQQPQQQQPQQQRQLDTSSDSRLQANRDNDGLSSASDNDDDDDDKEPDSGAESDIVEDYCGKLPLPSASEGSGSDDDDAELKQLPDAVSLLSSADGHASREEGDLSWDDTALTYSSSQPDLTGFGSASAIGPPSPTQQLPDLPEDSYNDDDNDNDNDADDDDAGSDDGQTPQRKRRRKTELVRSASAMSTLPLRGRRGRGDRGHSSSVSPAPPGNLHTELSDALGPLSPPSSGDFGLATRFDSQERLSTSRLYPQLTFDDDGGDDPMGDAAADANYQYDESQPPPAYRPRSPPNDYDSADSEREIESRRQSAIIADRRALEEAELLDVVAADVGMDAIIPPATARRFTRMKQTNRIRIANLMSDFSYPYPSRSQLSDQMADMLEER